MIQVIPTILESTVAEFNERRVILEPLVKRISLDFADNTLVPNTTVLPTELSELSPGVEYDAHLMVRQPGQYFPQLAKLGVKRILVHLESSEDIAVLAEKARALNLGFALTLNPETPITALVPHLPLVEFVQIMGIHPGFGGQPFVPETYDRIRELRELAPSLDIAIDGAVRYDNARALLDAGATILTVGKGGYILEGSAASGMVKWHQLLNEYQKGSHAR